MAKPISRAPQRRAGAPREDDSSRSSQSPAKRDTSDARPLLVRVLETPHLAQVVPQLQPEVLQRIIDRCGLEDCAELVALATPAQLAAVFDIDLWRSDRPGRDEQFDAGRFGVWLEVLLESGAAAAARMLADSDAALITAALAQHVRVFDTAARSPSLELAGHEVAADGAAGHDLSCEIGGYLVAAKGADAWDAIVAVLVALDAEYQTAFHRVMRGCRALSNSAPEVDGLDDLLTAPEQVMFDLAASRQHRREGQGYATPAEARAFLQTSRQRRAAGGAAQRGSPIAAAYFRALDETVAAGAHDAIEPPPSGSAPPALDGSATDGASLIELLFEEGVLPRPPRALLEGAQGEPSHLARMQSLMRGAHDADPAAYAMRSQELAFLANVLLAGCSIQARPLTVQEASNAAVAICNLGLENWPERSTAPKSKRSAVAENAALPETFLTDHDLVIVFQVGWRVLYEQVCMFSAERLIAILKDLTCGDREIQAGLRALRVDLRKHWQAGTPWRAREAMDVLTSLDLPAWAALLGLIAECPVLHAAVGASRQSGMHTVDASAFEFIAANSQIASMRAFLDALPGILRS